MEWVYAFLIGGLVVMVVCFIVILAVDDPELFTIITVFLALSFLVGWGLAHLFGWWGEWVRG